MIITQIQLFYFEAVRPVSVINPVEIFRNVQKRETKSVTSRED